MAVFLRAISKKLLTKSVVTCQPTVFNSTIVPFKHETREINETLDEMDEVIQSRTEDLPDSTLSNPYQKPKCKCILCKYNVPLDYKNSKLLSQFISRHTGQIYNQASTGLCRTQYNLVKLCIASSRQAGYMPYIYKDFDYLKDPILLAKKFRR